MASTISANSLAIAAPSVAPAVAEPKSFNGLKANTGLFNKAAKPLTTVSNGSKVSCMLVWPPYNNKRFETLSYLPPLTKEQVAKQVDYIIRSNWIPCLEFDRIGSVYIDNFHGSGYYDGRYWTMWKLPMFGCNDAGRRAARVQNDMYRYKPHKNVDVKKQRINMPAMQGNHRRNGAPMQTMTPNHPIQ